MVGFSQTGPFVFTVAVEVKPIGPPVWITGTADSRKEAHGLVELVAAEIDRGVLGVYETAS